MIFSVFSPFQIPPVHFVSCKAADNASPSAVLTDYSLSPSPFQKPTIRFRSNYTTFVLKMQVFLQIVQRVFADTTCRMQHPTTIKQTAPKNRLLGESKYRIWCE